MARGYPCRPNPFPKIMSTVRFSLIVAVLSVLLWGGCSSGQPAATGEGAEAGPVPVAAAGGETAGASAVTVTPAGAPPGTPPAEPEKSKEPEKGEKTDEKEAPKPPERIEVDLESLAAGLQSTIPTQVFTAGEFFRQIPAVQRREVLLQLSKHTDPNVRGNAWRVFSTVATKEDLATLSQALQSQYSDVKMAALETMARLPNDETISVLTKQLENPDYREFAAGLLAKIGPACEAAVLPYATHANPAIRRAAWEVLVHAGSRKSVQALEQLTTQAQYQKEESLKRSLEQLRERLRKS
jgi:hypothetical protein